MESAKEVNITYETLFEILKREKDMADLQKLDANFFENFVEYLNEKKKMMEKEDALFSYDEKKKVERQIDNAKRMAKEIYERREKKILNIALIKSRTKSNIIDTSALLENEKRLLDDAEKVLNHFRESIIRNVMEGRGPDLKDFFKGPIEVEGSADISNPKTEETREKDTKLVRFLASVPKFVGKELEEYGPFAEEDIANLPSEIANLLIGKGRVEEINSD